MKGSAAAALPDALRRRVEAVASAMHCSENEVVCEAVERAIEQLEWECHILQLSDDIRAGRVRTIPWEDVVAEFGPVGKGSLDQIE